MELTDDQRNYVFDVSNTVYSNVLLLPGFVIAYTYVTIFAEMLRAFTNPEMQIIAVFVFAWSAVKIVVSLCNSINLEYKPRQ